MIKMNKIKLILILLFSLIMSGCTVNYNITITEDSFDEEVIVNDFVTTTRNITDIANTYDEYYPREITELTELNNLICEKLEDCYAKNLLLQNDTGYMYSLNNNNQLEKLNNTPTWLFANNTKSFLDNNDNIIISTSKGLKYFDLAPDLTSVIITIKTDLAVTNSNADLVNNNEYTWLFSRDNYLNKNIFISITKNKEEEENPDNEDIPDSQNTEENNSIINIILIIVGFLVYIILMILILKKKNKNT